MKNYIILLLALIFSGCDSGPSVEERLAKATTLKQVVEAVTSEKPRQLTLLNPQSIWRLSFPVTTKACIVTMPCKLKS